MKKNLTVTRVAPAVTVKPQWLKKIHASGIHGCPQQNCPKCHAILVRSS